MAPPRILLRVRRARVRAEVARTPWRLFLGLMFRRRLPPDAGMLLRFPRIADHGLHMLNVRFPLDLVFLRADGTVARIARALPGGWGFYAGEPVRWCLEVNAGFCRRHGIRRGDRIRIPPPG